MGGARPPSSRARARHSRCCASGARSPRSVGCPRKARTRSAPGTPRPKAWTSPRPRPRQPGPRPEAAGGATATDFQMVSLAMVFLPEREAGTGGSAMPARGHSALPASAWASSVASTGVGPQPSPVSSEPLVDNYAVLVRLAAVAPSLRLSDMSLVPAAPVGQSGTEGFPPLPMRNCVL